MQDIDKLKRRRNGLRFFIQKNIKPLQPAGVFFSYSVVWAFPFLIFTCWVRAIRRLPNLSFACVQVTSYLMNALVHFVHRTIPLFLFLVRIPHGKDINHFNLPPFSIISPTTRRWDCLARWGILTFRSFAFWSYANHNFVPPSFFRCLF